MKRFLVLFLTLFLTVSMVSACGSVSEKKDASNSEKNESKPFADPDEETEDDTPDNKADLRSSDYKNNIDEAVEAAVNSVNEKGDAVLEKIGDSYESYSQSKTAISEWYALVLSESGVLYDKLVSETIEEYKVIASKCSEDKNFDWESAMDEIHDIWDDASDRYYTAWDDLFGKIYDKWDTALDDDSLDYSKRSEEWKEAYNERSDSWSAAYDVRNSSWIELSEDHSAVWIGFLSEQYDVDTLIREAKENKDGTITEAEPESESDPSGTLAEDTGSAEITTAPEDTENAEKSDEVTLDADNDYFIISDIDFSECTYENGYFKGYIKYNSHTTNKYVEKYDNYFFREIYFGFYNENGTLVEEESTWNNYIYAREYESDESTYVIVGSSTPIKEVKVTKIVLSKS